MKDDLAVRTHLSGSDDIGLLGQTIDALAEQMSDKIERLQSERDRLAAILETMSDGVLLTNAKGEIVLANASLRTICGISGQVIGRKPIEVIRSDELAGILQAVHEGQSPMTGEVELLGIVSRKLRVRAAPLAGLGIRGVVVVLSDITDLRRLETMRRDFVANVSHELRTPIAAIRAAAETLEGGAIDDPIAAEEFVGMIARHSERLHALVEDLLALSRIEANKLQLTPAAVDIPDFLRDMVELYTLSASRRGVTLVASAGDEGMAITTDRRALEQIVSNLIDNAIKYAGPRALVTLKWSGVDGEVCIMIQDTGSGIPAQHLPRLFERFYRVDRGRSRDVGGTGLGLAIVKHLAEALSGRVTVESVLGKGSTFTIHLPVHMTLPTSHQFQATRPRHAELSHEP